MNAVTSKNRIGHLLTRLTRSFFAKYFDLIRLTQNANQIDPFL